jgi:hypothetical protein
MPRRRRDADRAGARSVRTAYPLLATARSARRMARAAAHPCRAWPATARHVGSRTASCSRWSPCAPTEQRLSLIHRRPGQQAGLRQGVVALTVGRSARLGRFGWCAVPRSEAECEFVEGDANPIMQGEDGSDRVVAAPEALDEPVPSCDRARRGQSFESAHWPQPCLESAVIGFDAVAYCSVMCRGAGCSSSRMRG